MHRSLNTGMNVEKKWGWNNGCKQNLKESTVRWGHQVTVDLRRLAANLGYTDDMTVGQIDSDRKNWLGFIRMRSSCIA